MKKQIDDLKSIRTFLLHLIKDLSIEQMNEIPAGFNNNIVWNLAHLVAAQQGVCYIRAGLPPAADEKYVTLFRSGTKPGEAIKPDELSAIKEILLSSLDQLQADYDKKIFSGYTKWPTRYGVELASIEEAINFLGFHEGLHQGTIIALKKLVSK